MTYTVIIDWRINGEMDLIEPQVETLERLLEKHHSISLYPTPTRDVSFDYTKSKFSNYRDAKNFSEDLKKSRFFETITTTIVED